MEIKLNIYKTRSLKEVEKIYSVADFRLSFGACEDVLNAINIDLFEGGLDTLSDESKNTEIFKIVIKALPVFKDILKDVFEGLNDEELKRTDVGEIANAVINILTYSLSTLGKSINKSKN